MSLSSRRPRPMRRYCPGASRHEAWALHHRFQPPRIDHRRRRSLPSMARLACSPRCRCRSRRSRVPPRTGESHRIACRSRPAHRLRRMGRREPRQSNHSLETRRARAQRRGSGGGPSRNTRSKSSDKLGIPKREAELRRALRVIALSRRAQRVLHASRALKAQGAAQSRMTLPLLPERIVSKASW